MSGFYPFDVKPETFYEKGDFLISEELAAGLLETLPSLGEPKDGQRKEAIKKLKGENK